VPHLQVCDRVLELAIAQAIQSGVRHQNAGSRYDALNLCTRTRGLREFDGQHGRANRPPCELGEWAESTRREEEAESKKKGEAGVIKLEGGWASDSCGVGASGKAATRATHPVHREPLSVLLRVRARLRVPKLVNTRRARPGGARSSRLLRALFRETGATPPQSAQLARVDSGLKPARRSSGRPSAFVCTGETLMNGLLISLGNRFRRCLSLSLHPPPRPFASRTRCRCRCPLRLFHSALLGTLARVIQLSRSLRRLKFSQC